MIYGGVQWDKTSFKLKNSSIPGLDDSVVNLMIT